MWYLSVWLRKRLHAAHIFKAAGIIAVLTFAVGLRIVSDVNHMVKGGPKPVVPEVNYADA